MKKASISRAAALELLAFCRQHQKTVFFFAKDQGAYFGAVIGTFGEANFTRSIHYVAGCDPKKDEDWYDTARAIYGGDDFGEELPVKWLEILEQTPSAKQLTIKIKARSIELSI